MFNGLRNGSSFFILSKSDRPALKIGQVTAKSDPRPKYGVQQPYGYPQQMVVDVTVQAGEETYTFDALDANDSIRMYPDKNVFITDSREQMLAEVESMFRTSTQHIEAMPYHEGVVDACENIMRQLNPQLAKEKEQEEKIDALEGKISGIEGALGTIQDMLAKALNTSAGGRKSSTDK